MADIVVYDTVGAPEDTASATGSLHAKVADVKDQLDVLPSTRQAPRGVQGAAGSFYTGNNSAYQTALNITGKGKLVGLKLGDTASDHGFVKVTVDGTVISSGRGYNSGPHYPTPEWMFVTDGTTLIYDTIANGGTPINAAISFKTSLKIELKVFAGIGVYVYWQYELE